MYFLAAYGFPIAVLIFVVWQSYKVISTTMASNRRQRRRDELHAIITSTQYTSEERTAAVEKMLDESLRPR